MCNPLIVAWAKAVRARSTATKVALKQRTPAASEALSSAYNAEAAAKAAADEAGLDTSFCMDASFWARIEPLMK